MQHALLQHFKVNINEQLLAQYQKLVDVQEKNQIPSTNCQRLIQYYLLQGQNVLPDSSKLLVFSNEQTDDVNLIAFSLVHS